MSAEVTPIEREIVIQFEPEELDMLEDALGTALLVATGDDERCAAIRKLRDEMITIRKECRP